MPELPDLSYLHAAFAGDAGELWPAGADRGGRRMTWAAAARLIDMGVPRAFLGQLTGAGDLALAQVDLRRGGTFEFGGPDQRLILAVREFGAVSDLLALSSSCRDEWALLRGNAVLLGAEVLQDAILAERRELRLFATPFDWLCAGGRGVCVLDWGSAAVSALRGLRAWQTIVVDAGHRATLEAKLARGAMPFVAEERRGPVRRAA